MPSLAERADDIPLLVRHFLARIPAHVEAARSISDEALTELSKKSYPGNVRELLHTVERAAMLATGGTIVPSDLAFERILVSERARFGREILVDGSLPPFKDAKRTLVDEFERDYLAELMNRVGRNLSKASALAGVERHHLRELLRKHGLWGNEEA
jgi:DNA-binding NtrC family response regulator